MKANCKIFKGIEYVQLGDLPQEQQDKILQNTNHKTFIKILIEGEIVSQCLQYKDYSHWYENDYRNTVNTVMETIIAEPVAISTGLVLNKI